MAKNSFQFKQFTVYQDRCAMKVGTDGTLLGAWANAPVAAARILDIGTGTGLVALMMAQRFPEAQVTGIDIDEDAAQQAQENVVGSPFSDRIMINREDATKIDDKAGYDAIVCNPPYFNDSLLCPDTQRTVARHTTTLSYRDLMTVTATLLADEGELSVVIPFDCKSRLEAEASLAGLTKTRECRVKTTPRKEPRRYLLAFGKHPSDLELTEGVLETEPGVRSDWYHELTQDLYL